MFPYKGGTGDCLNFVQVIGSDPSLEFSSGCFCFQWHVGLGSSSAHKAVLLWHSGVFQPASVQAHQGTLALARRDACQGDLGFPKAPSVSVTERNVCWWELDLIIICWPGVGIPVFLLTCSVPHVPGIMLAQVARGRWRQRGFLWHLISWDLHWAKESFASFLSAVLEVAH